MGRALQAHVQASSCGFLRCWQRKAWCQPSASMVRSFQKLGLPARQKQLLARLSKQKKKSALETDRGFQVMAGDNMAESQVNRTKSQFRRVRAYGRVSFKHIHMASLSGRSLLKSPGLENSAEGTGSVPRAPQQCSGSWDFPGRRAGQQLALMKKSTATGFAFRGSTHACHAPKQNEPNSEPIL